MATKQQQDAFINRYSSAAMRIQELTGIPASVILGQAALESGWGQSELTQKGFNFFGVKQGSWGGAIMPMYTTEKNADGSTRPKEMAIFRKYGSAAESFLDHARVLRNPRYQKAFSTNDAYSFINEVQNAGYAGDDRTYAGDVSSIMRSHNLTRFDAMVKAKVGAQVDYNLNPPKLDGTGGTIKFDKATVDKLLEDFGDPNKKPSVIQNVFGNNPHSPVDTPDALKRFEDLNPSAKPLIELPGVVLDETVKGVEGFFTNMAAGIGRFVVIILLVVVVVVALFFSLKNMPKEG